MRLSMVALISCSVVGGAGCLGHGRQLVPSSAAQAAPGLAAAAVDDVSGVEVTVEADAWPRGLTPLERSVTPIRVTVENQSGRPVVVRHDDFALRGGSGQSYAALAPDEVAVANADQPLTVVEPVFGPARMAGNYDQNAYLPGPQAVPDLGRWETSFPYNSYYLRGYTVTPEARRAQPIVRALPEGTVAVGAKVRGFVYFDSGAYREHRVLFEASLVKSPRSPDEGVEVARARIPFSVR